MTSGEGASRTLTLVFTDLQGSTAALQKLGDESYTSLLDTHRRILRTAFEGEHGREFGAEGDSLFFAFESAASAIRAAVAAQAALRTHAWTVDEPRVRIGIHMGEVLHAGDELRGLAVHEAARICDAALGGQILASRQVVELVERRLSADVSLIDMGDVPLKSLTKPLHLYEVRSSDAGAESAAGQLPLSQRPIRLVFAEDNYLVREGTAALLAEVHGLDLVAVVEDLDGLLRAVADRAPDAVLSDIRMPPSHTTEGIEAATRIRKEYPDVAVVLLSQYVEYEYVRELLESGASGIGYLLKERVRDVDELVNTLRTVCAGGFVLDPKVVEALVANRQMAGSALARLTETERGVLEQMAQGKTNAAVAGILHMSERSVERHINSIFAKLALSEEKDVHRRVKAVLTFLESKTPS